MRHCAPRCRTRPLSSLTLALAGLIALGVAMGIGRFAFTPLLPMMLGERSGRPPGASLLASANYLGYTRERPHDRPRIFIGAVHVGGCDDLYALDRAGKLDCLLGADVRQDRVE